MNGKEKSWRRSCGLREGGREGLRVKKKKKTEDRAQSSDFHIYEAVALFACCSLLVHSRSVGSSGAVVCCRITTAATKTDSVAWVCERTIATELPPLVSEVCANFRGYRGVLWLEQRTPRPYSRFSRPGPLLFLPSSSSIVLTRLSGPRSRPTTSQKIW
jgi:hypothetical protein